MSQQSLILDGYNELFKINKYSTEEYVIIGNV